MYTFKLIVFINEPKGVLTLDALNETLSGYKQSYTTPQIIIMHSLII